MKIGFGSDHRGYKLKCELIKKVKELGYECIDYGCDSESRCDFPIYAFRVSEAKRDNLIDFGVVICGSGDGVCIASNKVKGIRCTLVVNKDDVIRAREHVNVNVIAIGSEKTSLDEAIKMIKALETKYLNDRHEIRLEMISKYEER